MDSFYNSIGGLAGYQLKCLEMMLGSKRDSTAEQLGSEPSVSADDATKYHMPQGLNIAYNRRAAAAAAATGLETLPHMGEILPLGGTPKSGSACSMVATPCLPLSSRLSLHAGMSVPHTWALLVSASCIRDDCRCWRQAGS